MVVEGRAGTKEGGRLGLGADGFGLGWDRIGWDQREVRLRGCLLACVLRLCSCVSNYVALTGSSSMEAIATS